jgi:histidinol phosphatase-like enzyme
VAKEKAIIVDVDGTLADMRGVRSPFEWDKVLQDKPHLDVIDLVKDLASLKKYKIIITTGRDGICEQDTVTWLRKYKGLRKYKVEFDDFYIRKEGDFRKDNIIKSEIYMDHIRPNYDVKYVIDDRDQVVDMWRSLGLRVLQVAPGNF